MISEPFPLLRQFEDRLTVGLFTKKDDIEGDATAGKAFGFSKTAGLNQVHGNRTIIVRDALARTEPADGMITDVPGLALCIRWADCQNFVIYEPKKNVCGALHAGWKGLIAGAIPEFFSVLKNKWGIEASEVFVGAGPSLCKRCADFSDPTRELPSVPKEFIDGKHVDLRLAAEKQLTGCGVLSSHIDRHPDCTRCDPEKFWTYRGGHRDEVKTGHANMLVAVMKSLPQ